MRDYVHRLVARLTDAERPLSRNRHFFTFDEPYGRRALRISRQIRSLAADIVEQVRAGGRVRIELVAPGGETVRVQVDHLRLKTRRTSFLSALSAGEYQLLLQAEGVRQALDRAA